MTPMFHPVPSLMLVGCEADLAEEFQRAFPGLRVLRVAHASAAAERMLVTRPLVVLLGEEIVDKRDDKLVIECAGDIRAEVIRVAGVPRETLPDEVRAALLEAERHREEPTSPPTRS
jgi:hypothetical protein